MKNKLIALGVSVGFLTALFLVGHFLGTPLSARPTTNVAHAATSGTLIGPYFWGGSVNGFSGDAIMSEGLSLAKSTGAKVIRIAMAPNVDETYQGTSSDIPNFTLTNLAKRADFNAILTDPQFTTVIITAYDGFSWANGSFANPSFYTPANTQQIETEYTDFADYLKQFSNKTFIIDNWEGDNQIYCDSAYQASLDGGSSCPEASTNLAGMTDWFRARYAGIHAAGASNVFDAIEINSVNMLKNAGLPSVLYNVIPNVSADYYSYSSYESLNSSADSTVAANQLATDINTIRAATHSNNVFIGELGTNVGVNYGSGSLDATQTAARLQTMISAAEGANVPYVITWALLDSPPGFGMFDTSGKTTPSGSTIENMIGSTTTTLATTTNQVTKPQGTGTVTVTVPSHFTGSATVQVTVTGQDGNNNTVSSTPIMLMVNAPIATGTVLQGTISASSSPCTMPTGGTACSSTISWQSNDPTAEVWVSIPGGLPIGEFASGESGTQVAPWINPTGVIFSLYSASSCSTVTCTGLPLASTTVYAQQATTSTTALAPLVHVDSPVAGVPVSGIVSVAGWVISRSSASISSLSFSVDGKYVAAIPIGTVARPDVCLTYPGSTGCPNVGFATGWDSTKVSNGVHVLEVSADPPAVPIGTFSVDVTVDNPNAAPPQTTYSWQCLNGAPSCVGSDGSTGNSACGAQPANVCSAGSGGGAGGGPGPGGIGPVGGSPSSGSTPYNYCHEESSVNLCMVSTSTIVNGVPTIVTTSTDSTKDPSQCPAIQNNICQNVTVTISPNVPNSITSGDTEPFTATVSCNGNGDACAGFDSSYTLTASPVNSISQAGSFTAPAIQSGLSAMYFTITAASTYPGAKAWTSVLVYAPPTCTAFSGSPSTITIPSRSTLSWTCQNAVSCMLTQNGGQAVPSSAGSCPANPFSSPATSNGTCTPIPAPATTTAYTLKCVNGATDGLTIPPSFPGAATTTMTTVIVQPNPGVQETNP